MKKHTITIAGTKFPMGFDVRAWVNELEPEFGSLTQMTDRLFGQDKPMTAGVYMLTMVINAGLRLAGENKTIKRDWLLDNLQPKELAAAIAAGEDAIFSCFEQEEKEDEGPVDVVLAELEAKKTTGRA